MTVSEIGLDEVASVAADMRAGKRKGRCIVDVNR